MGLSGILRDNYNTGAAGELLCVFAAPLSISSETVSSVVDTLNLRRKTSRAGAQRWRISARLAPDNNLVDLAVNLVISGTDQPIYIRMPQLIGVSQPDPQALLTVNGDYPAGTTALLYNSDIATQLNKGAFINFDGSSKVYMIKAAGPTFIELTSPLITPITSGARIANGDSVTLKAFLDADSITGITYSDGYLADPGTYNFVESI